jgi:hypothetical protein
VSAEVSIRVGILLAAGFAVGLGFYARWLFRWAKATWAEVALVVAASTAFGFAGLLPLAVNLARGDPVRAPAVFWLLLFWVAVTSTALGVLMRPRLTVGESISLALLAVMPAACLATPIGAVGGAMRTLRACQGNLAAIGVNFGRYVDESKHWPAEDKWVDDLLPWIDFPKAFRCPSRSDRDYVYHRPPESAPADHPIITCDHPFLRKRIVLHKDESVTVDDLPRSASPQR